MANHRANEPRTYLRVPVSFNERVLKEAHNAGMSASVFLENKTVMIVEVKE